MEKNGPVGIVHRVEFNPLHLWRAEMTTAVTNSETGSDVTSGSSAEWIETLARVGYAAKGVVYVIIGALALDLAFGGGGEGDAVGPQGAVATLAEQPFGQVLLGLIAVGLLSYAVWRFVQAAKDPEKKGSDAKGTVTRIGYVCSGIAYTAIAIEAGRMILSGGGGGEDKGAAHWTARLMELPFGKWLVAAAGLAMAGAGIYQFYRGYSAKFDKLLKAEEMSEAELTWGRRLGRAGFMARGVVYAIIAGFLLVAAYQANPDKAVGIGGAIGYLQETGYGPWLLGLVAAGLFAYGIFSTAILARFRRILGS